MTCDGVRRVLAMEDEAEPCDRTGLSAHLERCAACREAAPEIVPLMTGLAGIDDSGPLPARRVPARVPWRRIAAAALLLLPAAWLAAERPWREPGHPEPHAGPVQAPAPARIVSLSPETLVQSVVVHDRGRRFESRVSEGTWRAPLPRHLEAKENAR